MKAPATTVRIDPKLKDAANAVFDELGISLSAGVSAFLKAVVREQGMPFEMKLDMTRRLCRMNCAETQSLTALG